MCTNLTYYGSAHTFTDRTASSSIILQAGPNQNLYIPNLIITSSSLGSLSVTNLIATTETVGSLLATSGSFGSLSISSLNVTSETIGFLLTTSLSLKGTPITITGGSSLNFNISGATNITVPTSGTLATLDNITGVSINSIVNGRLTLTSGVPITSSDVSGNTIYFTPYLGNQVSIYNGSTWILRSFTELTISITQVQSDYFLNWNGSSVVLSEINNASRSLAKQDGVYVLSSDHTYRYIGTTQKINNGGVQVFDSNKYRLLWNYYNRVQKPLYFAISTNYSYSGNWRQAAGDSNNGLLYHDGQFSENQYSVTAVAKVIGPNSNAQVGIGANSTTVLSGVSSGSNSITGSSAGTLSTGTFNGFAGGLATISAIEQSPGASADIFWSNGGLTGTCYC